MLPELRAHAQLAAIQAAVAPHMEQRAFNRLIGRLEKPLAAQAPPVRPKSLAELRSLGVNIQEV